MGNQEQEAEALRVAYENPCHDRLPGESCGVTALAAKGIEGRVAFSGAAWYHPRIRGKGLLGLLPRMSRVIAHGRWDTEVTMTLTAEPLVARGVPQRAAYANMEFDVDCRNSRMGNVRFALLWSKTEEMIADIAAQLEEFDTEAGQSLMPTSIGRRASS